MTREELQQLITEVQQSQCELADIEVKSAHGGTPQRLYEPLSAFANRTEGGVILFGLDENRNFEIVGVGNAHRLQEEISHLVRTDMEPQIHPEFPVELFDGKTVVALEVSPVPADKRPCHYKNTGLQKGSYIRVGNTNRSMTDYEVFGYVSAQSQPTFDEEPITQATLEDLVTLETLEEEQSTRNRALVRLLEDLHLVENRGSGIKAMLGAMRSANLEPPRFQDKRSSFLVTMRNLTLMNTDAISWLNRFADKPLNDRQRLALVYLRHNQQITNFDYQRLAHVDSVTASRELRGLVQTGLTSQHSSRRWTHYTLNISIADKVEVTLPLLPEDKVLDYVRSHGFITRKQCADLLDLKDIPARMFLFRLRDKGIIKQTGFKKGSRYVLPE